jgi:hypothetical protein
MPEKRRNSGAISLKVKQVGGCDRDRTGDTRKTSEIPALSNVPKLYRVFGFSVGLPLGYQASPLILSAFPFGSGVGACSLSPGATTNESPIRLGTDGTELSRRRDFKRSEVSLGYRWPTGPCSPSSFRGTQGSWRSLSDELQTRRRSLPQIPV